MELINIKEKLLTKKEIEELYPLVNRSGEWQIRVESYELIDKLIELWFQSQGYDFWNNPYPDVEEWQITENDEIFFKYTPK